MRIELNSRGLRSTLEHCPCAMLRRSSMRMPTPPSATQAVSSSVAHAAQRTF
jgi:hypothetical protein